MTYEEIVLKVRDSFENADAREIYEHVAVQVNVVGEGSGAFYIEIANREAVVEPYDYHDRDGLITSDAQTLVAIADGKMTIHDAHSSGALRIEGNMDKLILLTKLKLKKLEA